jgi:ABC-2 type transport system permease protein
MTMSALNVHAMRVIYFAELGRSIRTLFQSLAAPVISTSLYFIVFGSAIGSRMQTVDGVPYGAFIVPGLIMMTILTESTSNASFGIYLPRFTGTIYEVLSAPVSIVETLVGYVGAAATKSVVLGMVIMATARLFVPYEIVHPFATAGFLVLTSLTFALFGFILGCWADGFEKLQVVPLLILSPLAFLGGTFYSIRMLPAPWHTVTLFNPIVYLVNGFRWAFYGKADVAVWVSLGMTLAFMLVCIAIVAWIFKTGYRLRT